MKIFSMFGDILVKNEASKVLDQIDKQTDSVGKKFKNFIGTAGKLGVGIVAGAGVAVGGLVKLTESAGDFEAELNNVGTLLDGNVKEKLDEFGGDLKKLSIDANTDTSLLTAGLYEVVSAVGDSADSMQQLEISAKAAKAGNATVSDSVKLLSAVTKGYGDTSKEAFTKVSDLAFQTVKLGQTTYPELAASMGKVVPLASTLKISQEELFGTTATLTGVTGNTAEVMTQLRAIMQGTLKPSKEMEAALQSMGFETGAAAVESLGLQGTLEGLKAEVGGNEVEFSNLFGSVEASTAALALTGTQADNFTKKTKAMSESTGAATKAFDQQNQGINAMKDQFSNYVKVIGIEVGQKLLPIMNKLLRWTIDNMPKILATIEKLWNGFIDVYEGIKGIVDDLISLFNDWRKENEDQISVIYKAWVDYIKAVKELFQIFIDFALKIWEEYGETFIKIVKIFVDQIMEYFKVFSTVVSNIFKALVALLKGDWQGFQEAITNITSAVIEYIEKSFKNMKKVVVAIWESLRDKIINVFTALKNKVMNITRDIVDGLINGLKNKINSAVNAAKELSNKVVSSIKNAFQIRSPSRVMKKIGGYIGEGLQLGIKSSESALLNQVASTSNKVLGGFGGNASLGIQAQSNNFTRPNIATPISNASGGSSGVVQNIVINSPTPLDAAEVARQTKKASQQMVVV